MNSVAQALADARVAGVDRPDAQWLLAHLLSRPRAWLITHDDAALSADQAALYAAWLRRRAAGEPLAYLLGEKEFHGLMLDVDPAVLVPRPDTETLVDWALELLRGELAHLQAPHVLDLGTGSGAIALAVKRDHPAAEVTAIDVSETALAVARRNAQRHRLDVTFAVSNWWQVVVGRRFDLVLSNPPYIAEGDVHLDALRHEPQGALRAGIDGLADLRRIAADAPAHLNSGGWLLFEHGHDQAGAVQALLRGNGLESVSTRLDLAGLARCTGARARPTAAA